MRLSISKFGNHADTIVEIPDSGISLFVGSNGSGKSMIGEALVWCLWSDPIRTSRRGWLPARPGSLVVLETKEGTYERRLTKSGSKFSRDGIGTTRDTNATVNKAFGSSRLYFSTRVFHRSLLVKFSNATDSERKALVEYLLGASEFDVWLKQVKAELKSLEPDLNQITKKLSDVQADMMFAEGQLDALHVPDKPKKSPEVKKAEKFVKSYKLIKVGKPPDQFEFRKAKEECDQIEYKVAELLHKRAKIESLIEAGKCPKCGQDVTKVMAGEHDSINVLIENHRVKRVEYKLAYTEAKRLYDEEETAYERKREKHDKNEQKKSRADYILNLYNEQLIEYEERLSQHKKALNIVKKEIQRLELKEMQLKYKLYVIELRKRRLLDLSKIYGSRGARVDMLYEAFDVLGNVSTTVAQSLYNKKVKVEVIPSEDLEKFSLLVVIPGDRSISYRGLSEGERSLIDFSLLKALAAVPQTKTGADKLPLIYDDILDAIDEGNQSRLVSFIQEEAKTQPIVVFSHDDSLLDKFSNATCYRVTEGRVKQL